MYALERRLLSGGHRSVAGVDEAGRGPLAGPVVAAAVVLDPEDPIEGLADSKKLTPKMMSTYGCVLIATDHTAYDYDWIVRHAKLVVDTRNATANVKKGRKKIVKA